jgi:preprotein translocase subunit Sss1
MAFQVVSAVKLLKAARVRATMEGWRVACAWGLGAQGLPRNGGCGGGSAVAGGGRAGPANEDGLCAGRRMFRGLRKPSRRQVLLLQVLGAVGRGLLGVIGHYIACATAGERGREVRATCTRVRARELAARRASRWPRFDFSLLTCL